MESRAVPETLASPRDPADMVREVRYWYEQYVQEPEAVASIIAARAAELETAADPGERRLAKAMRLLIAKAPETSLYSTLEP